jgi:hypothetical protein
MSKAMEYRYTVQPAAVPAPLGLPWGSPLWNRADEARVDHFHAASSLHRPITRARVLYDDENLYLRFHVEDLYVVAKHTQFQDPVYRDSCVEWFVQPLPSSGYFNFEINCGGALLCYYITDPARTPDGFAGFARLALEHAKCLRITHSMPSVVWPERVGAAVWQVGCQIPLVVLEAYTGPLRPLAGQVWRTNFFKCADDSSHPHWASWAPIGEALNFHQPEFFAPLDFAAVK